MVSRFARFIGALAALAAWVRPLDAQRWQMQYFYDREKSSLEIADLRFPSATRGVAVGFVDEGRRRKPVALVTADGGAQWQFVPLKEMPVSLFFLNENIGWMVTAKGLWQTREAGKSWLKLPRVPAQPVRVYFADEQNGWAACAKKTVLETHDGGAHWNPVAAASEQPGAKDYTWYSWIAFATPKLGIITGWNQPPQRHESRFPAWIDPVEAMSRRETPHLAITLETGDGGKTWKSHSASVFGLMTRVRFGPREIGLGLIEYSEAFRYPSEVFRIRWPIGRSDRVYRDTRFAVSDIWLSADGTAYLSGTLSRGELRGIVPGKVQVLRSKDLAAWTPVPVDYRAVAGRTILCAAGDRDLWLATDNGMILKLVP